MFIDCGSSVVFNRAHFMFSSCILRHLLLRHEFHLPTRRRVHDGNVIAADDVKTRFKIVYELHPLKPFVVLCRMPLTTAKLMAGSCVLNLGLQNFEIIPEINTLKLLFVGTFITCSLYASTYVLLSNIIAKAYVSNDKKEALISYINHHGRRKDVLLTTEDLFMKVHILNTSRFLSKVYVEGCKMPLKIFLGGKIKDEKLFYFLFGYDSKPN